MRLTRGVDPSRIVHIPHVLYHWRAIETSTARDGAAKPHAVAAGTRAVADSLDAAGVEARVEVVGGAFQRVKYPLPHPAPAVDVIIPSACTHQYLEPCLKGLLQETSYPNLQLTLVINERLYDDPVKAEFPGCDRERDGRERRAASRTPFAGTGAESAL